MLIPIVIAMGLVILRNSRARRLRIEAMWITPVMIVALIGLALYGETARGGLVRVRLAGERVKIGGQAVTVLRGELLDDG